MLAVGGVFAPLGRMAATGIGIRCGIGEGIATGFAAGAVDGYYQTGSIGGALESGLWGGLMGGAAGYVAGRICFVRGTQIVVGLKVREADGSIRTITAKQLAAMQAECERDGGGTMTMLMLRIVGYVTAPIESLRKGDYVISRDENDPDGPLVARRITEKYERIADHLEIVGIEDDLGRSQTVQTTDEHPFYVVGQGFTPSQSLAEHDPLSGPRKTGSAVASNARESHPEGVKVYNFEVEGSHTYFVQAEGSDAEPVWVHNFCEMRPARMDASNRLKSRTAKITLADLDSGTATTEAARRLARRLGLSDDDAGHLIGRLLGGPGGAKSQNIFPQNLSINRGQFAQFEGDVADIVRSGHDVFIRVKLEYSNVSTRPTAIQYQVRYGGQTQMIQSFPNPV